MRILITGAAGFLGHHLVVNFLHQGHGVIGIDNMSGGSNIVSHPNYEFYNADCTDFEAMKEIFEREKPEVVYHCACFPHEGLSVVSPFLVVKSVTDGTMAPLSVSAQTNVRKFIFCSTMARYGYQPQLPFTESMVPNPVDPYGWAKYAAEGQVEAICKAHGMEYAIVVPHNIYGPYQKYDDPFRNVAAIMINRALRGLQPIIYGDGKQKRCFSHVDDLIQPFMMLAKEGLCNGEVINLGPDEDFIEINQLASIICDKVGLPFKPIYVDPRPREVKHANCSAEKAKRLLGVHFKTSIWDGIDSLIKFIKEEGPKEFIYHLPVEIDSKATPRTWVDKLI